MSTTCPGCTRAIKVEDLVVKSYTPVNDLQTCGKIKITKRGRVAAKRIQCGDGIDCDGVMEGSVETDGDVRLGPKASWKGRTLQSRSLAIADGAKLLGAVTVPWPRAEQKRPKRPAPAKKRVVKSAVARAKKKTAKKRG
jgi:cytoskeletal protein CcmA (bactofilin family)